MVIYLYSLPAILAFLTKIGLLVYAVRSPVRGIRTRLFIAAVVASMLLNVLEAGAFQGIGALLVYAGYVYYALLIALLAILTHLTFKVTFANPPVWADRVVPSLIYGYAGALLLLLTFTKQLIVGFEWLHGYTYTRIPGPFFNLIEVYALGTLLIILALPMFGLRTNSGSTRSRCRIWMMASAPSAAIIIGVLALLHFNIRWFTASVTLPIPMALLLLAIAYCLYGKRVIDPAWYFPFSALRKQKNEMYEKLSAFSDKSNLSRSVTQLLVNLEAALQCSVRLLAPNGQMYSSNESSFNLTEFPQGVLENIDRMATIEDALPSLSATMRQHRIGAIAPLFPTSKKARSWLFFGETFGHRIYTPADYQKIDKAIRGLAGAFLDTFAPNSGHGDSILPISQQNATSNSASLSERLENYETLLINEALRICDGNQTKAAKLLGLRKNTLHYKLKRLGVPVMQET